VNAAACGADATRVVHFVDGARVAHVDSDDSDAFSLSAGSSSDDSDERRAGTGGTA
jgi:hypothetical protein